MSNDVLVLFAALCCAGCDPSQDARFPDKLKALEFYESHRSSLDAMADRILGDKNISGVTCYAEGQAVLRSLDGANVKLDEAETRGYSELCRRADLGLVWKTDAGVYVDGGFAIVGDTRFNAGLFRRLGPDSMQADCEAVTEFGQVGACRFHLAGEWYLQYEWHPVEIAEADAN